MKTDKSKLYVYSTNKTVSNIEDMKFFVMPTEVAVDDMSRQQIMYHPNAKYKLYYTKVQNDTGEYYRFGCIDREDAVWQYKDLFESKDIDIQDHYIEESDLPSIGYHYFYEKSNGKSYTLTDHNFDISAPSNSSISIPRFTKLVMVTKSLQVYLLGDFYYRKSQHGKEEYSFNILDYFSSITEAIKAKESMSKAYKRVSKLTHHTLSVICVQYGSITDESFQIQLYAERARNKKKFHHEVSDIPMIYFDKSGEITESVLCADEKLDDFEP